MSYSTKTSNTAGVRKRKSSDSNSTSYERLSTVDHADADTAASAGTTSSKQKRKRANPEPHYRDVFIVKFITEREGSDYHRALLVEYSRERGAINGEPISRGELYEVTGPVHITGKPICKYVFEPKQDQAPENAEDFIGPKVKLGRVADNQLDTFFTTCESVHPPRGPLNYDGPPDCNDWLNNVIVRLKQRSVVDFDPDYTVPTAEVSMVWMTGTT